MSETTVLVVGAGPTGLTLACDLARRGVAVRIVDKAPEHFAGSRGKGLQPRSMEVFDDLGVVGEILAAGWRDLPIRYYEGTRMAREVDPAEDRQPDPTVPYPGTHIMPQWRVEEILRARLAEFGVRVELGTELLEFTQDEQAVLATLRGPDGVEQTGAEYLAGCDGGHSTVRRALGLEFVGESDKTDAMIIGDLEVEGLREDRWHMWLVPERGFLAMCPFPATRSWQVQVAVLPDENGRLPEPSVANFRRVFDDLAGVPGVRMDNPNWLSTYRVNERMVQRFRVGRTFLAGDAAHCHSPAGGLGMNTGVQDAYNLGWKLASVVAGVADDTLLDTYEQERLPIAQWTLGISGQRLRGMVDEIGKGVDGNFLPKGNRETSQLALGYRWSSINCELVPRNGLLRAGDRAPDAPLTDDSGAGVRLFDLFRGTEHTLLGFGGGCAAALASTQLRSFLVTRTDAGSLRDEHGVAFGAYGVATDTLVLVRPDGYVRAFAAPGDLDALLELCTPVSARAN